MWLNKNESLKEVTRKITKVMYKKLFGVKYTIVYSKQMSKNKPSTSMAHVAWESKLHSVVSSSMHPCPGNWVSIGRAVVYYTKAAHTLSAGIRCRHCNVEAYGNIQKYF